MMETAMVKHVNFKIYLGNIEKRQLPRPNKNIRIVKTDV